MFCSDTFALDDKSLLFEAIMFINTRLPNISSYTRRVLTSAFNAFLSRGLLEKLRDVEDTSVIPLYLVIIIQEDGAMKKILLVKMWIKTR